MDIDVSARKKNAYICQYCKAPISQGHFCNDDCIAAHEKKIQRAHDKRCRCCKTRRITPPYQFCDEHCLKNAIDNPSLINDNADIRLKQKIIEFSKKIKKE